MSLKTIYMGMESIDVFNKIKEQEPNFNLSNFTRQALAKYHEGTILDLAEIEKKKNDIDLKIQELQNQKKYWDDKTIEYFATQKRIEEQEKERQKVEQKKLNTLKDKEEYRKEMVFGVFKEMTGKNMTAEQYNLYIKKKKEGKYESLYDFVKDVE